MLPLLIILLLYVLILLGVSWFSLHPVRTPVFISPEAIGAVQEEVEFSLPGGLRIRGWYVAAPAAQVVLVHCHGYLMNRCELTPLAVELWKSGMSSLLIDFRAHGKSDGRKCGFGWREREEVAAAVRFVREREPRAKVVLVGSSMGAAASAFALGEDPSLADALILDSAYSNLTSAVLGWWRFLGGPILSVILAPTVVLAAPFAGFNPWKADVGEALRRFRGPVLLVHGDKDNLALPKEATRNESACGGVAALVWMPGCGHSEGRWIHPANYYAAVKNFLAKVSRSANTADEPMSDPKKLPRTN